MMNIGQAIDHANAVRVLRAAWSTRDSIDGNCEYTTHIVSDFDCYLCESLVPYCGCEVGLTLAGSGIEMFDLNTNATIVSEEI